MADSLHHRWQAFTRCVRHHRVDGRMRLKMPNAAANGKRSAGGAVTKLRMSERKKKNSEEEEEALKQKLVGGRNVLLPFSANSPCGVAYRVGGLMCGLSKILHKFGAALVVPAATVMHVSS